MQDNQEEKKKAILKAEQLAVQQARQEREAIISEARQLEEEMCRNVMEAGESLKNELKSVKHPAEKAALKQALKETQSSGRQTISRAKKNAETQVRIAFEQEKESIRRAKAEKEQALKDLKLSTIAKSARADELVASLEDGDLEEPPAGIDAQSFGMAQELDVHEIQHQALEEKQHTSQEGETVSQPVESFPDENPESREDGGRHSGYADIFRSLEEIGRKLEASRKARLEINTQAVENSNAAEILQVRPSGATGEAPFGKSGESVAEPTEPEQAVQEKAATAGKSPDESGVQPEIEKAGLFEGRVRIIVQNPSAVAVKTLGEKLKRIDDVKMLLFGGSADEGIQIIVMVLKPIPLVERIEQTGQVEVVSSTPNEITLRFKS
ncbi:MAG: hypothetical protein JW954_07305 [Dehalococcoidaceae bacterium]|nr:hypothetical protein [Dehalococcoidaceae bacterium]